MGGVEPDVQEQRGQRVALGDAPGPIPVRAAPDDGGDEVEQPRVVDTLAEVLQEVGEDDRGERVPHVVDRQGESALAGHGRFQLGQEALGVPPGAVAVGAAQEARLEGRPHRAQQGGRDDPVDQVADGQGPVAPAVRLGDAHRATPAGVVATRLDEEGQQAAQRADFPRAQVGVGDAVRARGRAAAGAEGLVRRQERPGREHGVQGRRDDHAPRGRRGGRGGRGAASAAAEGVGRTGPRRGRRRPPDLGVVIHGRARGRVARKRATARSRGSAVSPHPRAA